MPAYILMDWSRYYAEEPWGEERADVRAGIIAAVIANSNRGKSGKKFRIRDFLAGALMKPKKPLTEEERLNKAWAIAQAMGMKIIDKRKKGHGD